LQQLLVTLKHQITTIVITAVITCRLLGINWQTMTPHFTLMMMMMMMM